MNRAKIKCWNCGADAEETRFIISSRGSFDRARVSPYHRCYCKACRKAIDEKEIADRKLYVKLRKQEMFKKACVALEKQSTRMYEYKEAIDAVEEFIEENPDKFDSSYEVLAAIVLIHNRIHCKMQQKIGKYQVDFILPDLFVVLEIDGDRHKHRKEYDSARDIAIQEALGAGWDIIRIPTEHLDKNAKKLPKAIYKTIEYRQTGKVKWREL